jgi:iron(III) transport system substrate-binding protein
MRKTAVCRAMAAFLGVVVVLAMSSVPKSEGGQANDGFAPALVAQAKKEGTFTVYHTQVPAAMAQLLKAFEAKFGIRGEVYRATGYDLQQKYVAESKSGQWAADVVQLSDMMEIGNLVKLGVIGEYLPTIDKDFPDSMKIRARAYPLHIVQVGIAYNADQVKSEDAKLFEKWEGILDPRWKGKMGIVYPTGGTTYMPNYMWAFGYPDRFGMKFLEGVAAQKPTIFTSTVPTAERLTAGEIAVVAHLNDNTTYLYYQKGAPIRLSYPSPTPSIPELIFMSGNPPHPNAARLFLEWGLSKEGQETWMGINGAASARSDVDDPRKLSKETWYKKPTEVYLPKDWVDFSQRRTGYLETWRKTFKYNP